MTLGLGINFWRRRVGSAFTPASLFTAGESGYWLDPSDFTTMWQDNQGVTPVTATGQTCGLILDKRIGTRTQVFSDANVTFTGAAGYSGRVSPGVYEYARDAGGIGSVVFGGLTTGRTYLVSVQISAYAGAVPGIAAIRADFFSALNVGLRPFAAAAGTYTFFYLADGSNFTICAGGPGTGGTISNVSILEVPGNHFLQATAGNRPILGVEPAGGRRNLLTRTEEFENAVWVKTNIAVTPNNAIAPDGTMTADTVTSNAVNSLIRQFFIFEAATYRFSLWLRRVSGTGVVEGTLNNFNYTNFALTSEWQRFSFSWTPIAGNNYFQVRFGSSGDVVEMWGAQLELGTTTTAYQRVTDQWNVTQAGVPDCYYLAFDGTDDWLQSAATINPGAVDKAQVFAGVRKLSDAAIGMLVEASNTLDTNNGTFNIYSGTGPVWTWASKGTLRAFTNPSGFTAPITNVLTGIGDISGDSAILRVNGAQAASSTADQGTGNYLTYTHYIGRRGGTSLPFNGRVYQMVMRFGPNLTAAQITQTENYVAGETGIYNVEQLNRFAVINASGASFNAYGAADADSNNYLVPKTVLAADGTPYSVL